VEATQEPDNEQTRHGGRFNPSPLIQTIIDDETLMNHHIHPELKGLIVQGVDIAKCYSSVMLTNTKPSSPSTSIHDTMQEWKGGKIEVGRILHRPSHPAVEIQLPAGDSSGILLLILSSKNCWMKPTSRMKISSGF
jgi:hypothetical protein